MLIRENFFEVQVADIDHRYQEHSAWFKRNDVPHVPLSKRDNGMKGWMDKITVTRWERYFDIPHPTNDVDETDTEKFESYAALNMDLSKDDNGFYKDDNTFQAWQFYKLGRG